MTKRDRFPFIATAEDAGPIARLPYLPLTLNHQAQTVTVSGLIDTGSTVNVMPYEVGLQLGAIWAEQRQVVRLTGNLANYEARVLVTSGAVADFPTVRLAFAWTRAESVPLLLGQVNFLVAYNVCLFRSEETFEVWLAEM